MSIELHCHTLFSPDARGTPEELVDIAAERHISTLAITEHNDLGSYPRAARRAAAHGIRILSGVEINATRGHDNLHLLAYGFDLENAALRALINRNSALVTQQGWILLRKLQQEGFPLDRAEVVAALPARYPTHPAPILNIWHLREICLACDYLPDKESYLALQKRLWTEALAEDPGLACPFASFDAVRDAVRDADGILLLAHVSQYRPGDLAGQLGLISELLENGLDGFELYHPANIAEAHFAALADFAKERQCPISGGSDCHHATSLEGNPLGSVNVPESVLESLDRALAQRA